MYYSPAVSKKFSIYSHPSLLTGQIYDYRDYSLIIAYPQHMGQCIINQLSCGYNNMFACVLLCLSNLGGLRTFLSLTQYRASQGLCIHHLLHNGFYLEFINPMGLIPCTVSEACTQTNNISLVLVLISTIMYHTWL